MKVESLREVNNNFSEVIEGLSGTGPVVVTKNGSAALLTRISQRAPEAQITSGGRTHPRRLLVELGSLRASEPGNRLGRSLAIKPTNGG